MVTSRSWSVAAPAATLLGMEPFRREQDVRQRSLGTAVEYPESDGQPMGETDLHRRVMQEDVIEVLEDVLAERPDAYVAGNNFLYWREGDPSACVSPDGYVVLGLSKGDRRTFKVWEEGGRTPDFVMEVTSNSTHADDRGRKKAIYEEVLQVPDYFLFDPTEDWIEGRLRGFTLEGGRYRELAPDSRGRLVSRVLGLELGVVDGRLRFFRLGAADPIPTRRERIARAERERGLAELERERADLERERADRAEAELERLRAEVRRLRGEAP